MDSIYNKTNKNILKGEIFIYSRNTYIEYISNSFLINKIIPIEYIDKQINLDYIRKGNTTNIINDTIRLQFIIDLLKKECIKGTSKLISDLCN
jgi:hypothetical protein